MKKTQSNVDEVILRKRAQACFFDGPNSEKIIDIDHKIELLKNKEDPNNINYIL